MQSYDKKYRVIIKDVFIIFLIVLIGIMIRLPIGNIGDIDDSELHDPDSFLYARIATDMAEKPINEWKIFINRSDDSLMNTVDSQNDPFTTNFLPALAALLYKTVKCISIKTIIFYFNIVLCPLSVIPTYCFVKKHINRVGAIFSSLMMAVSPAFFIHTMAGYFDTDAIIMVLALTFILLHIESFLSCSKVSQVLLSVFSLLNLVLFYFSWEAYYAYAAIAVVITISMLIYNRFNKIEKDFSIPITSTIVMVLFCVATSGAASKGSLGRTIHKMINGSAWPDESKYIGELTKAKLVGDGVNSGFYASPFGLINWLGGYPAFVVLIISIVFLLCVIIKKRKLENIVYENNLMIFIALFVWILIVTPFICFGVRFIQFVSLPANLIIGMGAGIIFDDVGDRTITHSVKDIVMILVSTLVFGSLMAINFYLAICVALLVLGISLKRDSIALKPLWIVVLIATVICPITSEVYMSKNTKAYVNKDFIEATNYINNNLSSDVSLVSWWGYGYYFQYATNRQTLSDGGIYDGAYFYWLANVFTSNDERIAKGICRMLQTGSIEAVRLVDSVTNDSEKTSMILKELFTHDINEASNILIEKYNFPKDKINSIVLSLNPLDERDMYLIIYDDMEAISGPIAYYGLWDFHSKREYEAKYNEETGLIKPPKELNNSIMEKYLHPDGNNKWETVYSNGSIKIVKMD